MAKKAPIVNIKPADIEVMKPEEFEPPEMFIVVDEPVGQKYCDHSQIRVYPHYRLIKCRQCQKTIDPFDYILQTGQQSHNFLSHMKYLKIQMDGMVKQEEAMRKAMKKHKYKPKP